MKKTISILTMFLCLFFVIVGCDSNTTINVPGPEDLPAVDHNVPSEDKFKPAGDDDLRTMIQMYMTTGKPLSETGKETGVIKCLDGATLNGESASGYLEYTINSRMATNETIYSGTFTIGGVEYSTERFVRTSSYNSETQEYDGVVTANGEVLDKEASSRIIGEFEFAPNSSECSEIQLECSSYYKTIFPDITGETSSIQKALNSETSNKYYLKLVTGEHIMTMGTMFSHNYTTNQDTEKFLYLSLDGRYFDEATFNQFMDAVNSEN